MYRSFYDHCSDLGGEEEKGHLQSKHAQTQSYFFLDKCRDIYTPEDREYQNISERQ